MIVIGLAVSEPQWWDGEIEKERGVLMARIARGVRDIAIATFMVAFYITGLWLMFVQPLLR
jgi:hypothetical protein